MRFIHALLPFPVASAVVIACFDAPQTITGGTPQFDAQYVPNPLDASDAEAGGCWPTDASGATWTSLYANLFGPSGIGQCGDASRGDSNGSTSCHHDSGGNGAISSGFICGDTQESCYQGITSSMASFLGSPVVIPGNPCGSFLTKVLRSSSGGIMPFLPDAVVFSDDQMASVATWIAMGALDN